MKKLLSLALASTALFSLTLDEAVTRGVSNSSSIKNAQYQVHTKELDLKLTQSNFHPSVDAQYAYTDRDSDAAGADDAYGIISLTASINLFNGMSDIFNEKSAEQNLEVAKLEKIATTSDLKLSIKQNYINHLNAKMEKKNQEASLALLEEQYSNAKLQFEQGIIAKDDLLEVEVNMLNVKKALLNAKANVKTSWLALKRVLGGDLKKDESILEPKAGITSFQYAGLKETMFNTRSELKALAFSKNALKYSKESIEGANLPKADLSLNHNIYEEEKKSGGVITQPENDTTTTLTLSWNLYNGGKTKHNAEKVKYNSLVVDENIKDLKLNLEYQLESAYEDLVIAKETLVVAKKAKESATESYNAVNDKYREGVATNTELLDAREDLTKASSDLNSAKYNLLLTIAKLERVIGE